MDPCLLSLPLALLLSCFIALLLSHSLLRSPLSLILFLSPGTPYPLPTMSVSPSPFYTPLLCASFLAQVSRGNSSPDGLKVSEHVHLFHVKARAI